jgi:hypothetical protein
MRLKKGDRHGRTSNFSTNRVKKMRAAADRIALFSEATALDLFIEEGNWIDVVYCAGQAMHEYTQSGIRIAMADVSPFFTIPLASPAHLMSISPTAYQIAAEARERLSA